MIIGHAETQALLEPLGPSRLGRKAGGKGADQKQHKKKDQATKAKAGDSTGDGGDDEAGETGKEAAAGEEDGRDVEASSVEEESGDDIDEDEDEDLDLDEDEDEDEDDGAGELLSVSPYVSML